jgi:hypothetical protein
LFDWVRDADLKDASVMMRFHRGVYGEKNAVKNQRENLRRHALVMQYDYLFFVGADTIPPLDVLPKLLSRNVDVVGGVYYGRTESENGLNFKAVAWRHKEPNFALRENLEKRTDLVEVDGMGCDCLLLSKKAFKSVSWLDWPQNDDDYPIYDKLKEQGFKIWLDTEIVCKHFYSLGKYN